MKRLLLVAVAATILASSTGCCLIDRLFFVRRCYPLTGQGGCQAMCSRCGAGVRECRCGHANGGYIGQARRNREAAYDGYYSGQTHGAVAYPYYTTRGPRDYFADDPQSIGP